MIKQWLERTDQRANNAAHAFGNLLVDGFHNLALFAIGGTIVWSAVHAFMVMTAGALPDLCRDDGADADDDFRHPGPP